MTHESSNSPHDSTAHERVRAVFFEVCDLPPAQRDAAIDQACGGDAALRAAVQKLLRRDGPERDLLADDAIESGAAFDPMNADADADADGNGNGIATTDASGARLAPSPRGARLPAEIGGYRILRRIGAGGMGTVYEAEQRDPRRIVALKTLQRWAASTSLIRRFRHETQVLGALQHPGIAQIFEARVHDPGDGGPAVPFFVMELVRGKPVTAFIRDAQLPVAERLRLFVRICAAVAYAHQHGVIHRDLKPDNILVDEQGNPKILDFGIAKSTRPDTHDKHDQLVTTLHTDVGQLVGTLPYMSPEQVGGDTALVDSRSDVYALGVVLYEMLTDRLPYEVRDRTLPEAVRVIREESHTRLSAVDRVFRGDLETILAKALEKDADRRYQSVPQLSQDVQRFLDHEPISARPPSTFYQLSKFARRNKALVGGVVGVIAALTLGVIGTTKFALDAAAREREQRWSSYLARIDAAAAALARHDVPSARRHLDEAPPEHRGWEWGHLERNLQQWAIEIDCGAALVGGASFLHGDDRVVAALADDRVCCWDVASGRTLLSLPVDGGIWRMADAPAGSLVAIATKRGDVVVIDMDSGLEADRWSVVDDSRPALEGATDKTSGLSSPEAINDLAISPDGAMVVLGTSTAVIAWSRRDRHEHRIAWQQDVTQQPRSPNGFHNVTISADGSVVAAAERLMQNRVRIWTWELSSGIARPPHRSNDAGPAVALRPGGRELAVGSTVRDVMILDTSAVSGPRALTGHTSAVRGVAYSPDGRRLASQARDSTIRVRSADDGRTLQVMYAPDGEARSAAPPHIDDSRLSFSADGSRLVSHVPGEAARILVWDVPDEPSLVLRGHTSYVYAAAFSPDGAMLASSTFGDGTLRLWDPLSGAALAVLGRLARATELRFADQGERVQVGRLGDREWDTATGAMTKKPNVERRPRVAPEANAESGPGFEADGTSSSETRSPAPQWNAFAADPTGRLEARFLRDRAPRSPAASIVQLHALDAAGAPPGAPPDATSRAASHDLVHDSRVSSAAFSPDGALLAVGCDNGEIVIWNVARRSREATLHRHAERVYAVAFSPDGRRLASGGNDNSLRLWDTATWDQVLERHEHESYIYAIAFSPDGTQIATASGDSTLRVWDSIDKPRRLAQVRAAAAMRDELRPRVAAMLAAARDTRTGPARPGETEADDVAGAARGSVARRRPSTGGARGARVGAAVASASNEPNQASQANQANPMIHSSPRSRRTAPLSEPPRLSIRPSRFPSTTQSRRRSTSRATIVPRSSASSIATTTTADARPTPTRRSARPRAGWSRTCPAMASPASRWSPRTATRFPSMRWSTRTSRRRRHASTSSRRSSARSTSRSSSSSPTSRR
ncbi:MAG: protein kinase [Phycisphaerales bacterium]